MTEPLDDGTCGLWNKQPTVARAVRIDASPFEWIETTDDAEFADTRRRLESLWLRIPKDNRPQFTSRLRSKRYTEFLSTYNELWYLNALEAAGFQCSLAESILTGSLPDLLLSVGQEPVAIAECYLRMEPEEAYRDDFVRRVWFDATFRKLKDKRVRLLLHEIVCGKGSPSSARLAATLNKLATGCPVQEIVGPTQSHGRHRYTDEESGWTLDFTLMVRTAPPSDAVAQLLYAGPVTAEWCQGAELLEEAISRKAEQHVNPPYPTVICVGWNYFHHTPDLPEVSRVVAERSTSLTKRGVHGVFWAKSIYPWNSALAAPTLLQWESPEITPILGAWKGPVINVNKGAQP